MRTEDYEKLGAFYLGRRVDLETSEDLPESLLYDSKDLTIHAVIVGMTGSGQRRKTETGLLRQGLSCWGAVPSKRAAGAVRPPGFLTVDQRLE